MYEALGVVEGDGGGVVQRDPESDTTDGHVTDEGGGAGHQGHHASLQVGDVAVLAIRHEAPDDAVVPGVQHEDPLARGGVERPGGGEEAGDRVRADADGGWAVEVPVDGVVPAEDADTAAGQADEHLAAVVDLKNVDILKLCTRFYLISFTVYHWT